MKRGLKGILSFLMAFMICVGIGLLVAPQEVHAEITTGTWGTATYEIDDENNLVFTGSGEISKIWPRGIKSKVVSISCADDVTIKLPSDSEGLFMDCDNLTRFDGSKGFDTSGVTNMQYLFARSTNLASIDVSSFDTSNVTNMYLMFGSAEKYGRRVYMNVESITIGPSFKTDNVTNMCGMFQWCYKLTSLDVSGFDTSNVTGMSYMFNGCSGLTSLDVSGFDTSKVTDMGSMFRFCSNLTSLDVSGFDTSKVTNMQSMFYNCSSLTSLDVSKFDTSKVTNMDSMFRNCSKLTSLDVSGFDTSNATSMWGMFEGCSGLTSLDVSGFDTSKVTTMDSMFRNCSSLTSLDVSNFNTSKVVNMGSMFNYCNSLESVDLSGFDTSNVTNMSQMFYHCDNLVSLDLSNFDTSKLTNMREMFAQCDRLETLDLYQFDMTNVSSGVNAFEGLNISRLHLGPSAVIKGADLNRMQTGFIIVIPNEKDGIYYTGNWIREDGAYREEDSELIIANWRPEKAGWWIWEVRPHCNVQFAVDGDATGAMPNTPLFSEEDFEIPNCQYAIFDHTFLYWDDGQGHQYENKATIPAGTYAPGSTVTLTAVFEANSHNVSMQDGAFEFSIKAGEKATFDNIPAGTTYQIYEKTEDGWVLVQQENASGVIEALEESAASFWNKYQPGVVTVQFTGTKKLDGHPAKEGSYQFELLDEHRNVIQTKTLFDGGFIQFDPIEYTKDDLGEHKYIIREIDPQDDSIDYDTHEETVNVLVKENVISEGLTVHSYSDNLNESGEKESDYISNKNYTDVITIPGAEKLHVTVKYTNPRGHFWIWQGAYANVHSQNWNATCNPDTALKNYIYQSGKDQEFLTDEFDVMGDSISVLYSSYAYPSSYGYYPNGPYSDMVNYGYYITVSSDTTELAADVTYDEDGVEFNNTTRPGILKITKDGSELTEANKDDTFTFEITFSNENGMPISDNIYWYVENGADVSAE